MKNPTEISKKTRINYYPGFYPSSVGIPSVGSSSGRIESEEKFIVELGKDSPNYKNLIFFLIGLEPGQVRVNFIAKMVEKNKNAMDNVFRDLVESGLRGKSCGNSVKILIDDFINPASNFDIVKDFKGVNHIFNATHHGKSELVKHILERDPDSVNIVSSRGGSLIHVAVSNRMSNVLKELLNCSKLDLYALRTRKDKDTTIVVESVFDIAKINSDKHKRIQQMLLREHERRFNSGDPAAIAFENTSKILAPSTNPQDHLNPSDTIKNTTMSLEGHNGSLQQAIIENREEGSSAYSDPSGPPVIPAVDPKAIAFEIVRSSDKSIKVGEEMASSSINPDASQVSFQLEEEEVMVWDNPEYRGFTCNEEMANMFGEEVAGSKNESRPPVIPAVRETTNLTQIIDSINQKHEVKDQQHISSSDDRKSAFSSVKKRRMDNPKQEQSNESANTTSEAMQSIDNGGRIASSTSPISQKSLSESDLGKGGSK
jgi:hypothetical protein